MGAVDFQTYGLGRDAREAFKQAVESAQWEYGHGGYTGTIAEKPSYSLVTLPPRVTTDKFLRWLQIEAWSDVSWAREELKRLEHTRAPRGAGETWRKRKADLRKQIKQAERERASIPAQHRALVERCAKTFDDKWGPALAFEVRGTEAKKVKAWAGLKGTRKRVFCFCGLASS
jgi:hypothetical protein